jgi:hypothetical protein
VKTGLKRKRTPLDDEGGKAFSDRDYKKWDEIRGKFNSQAKKSPTFEKSGTSLPGS